MIFIALACLVILAGTIDGQTVSSFTIMAFNNNCSSPDNLFYAKKMNVDDQCVATSFGSAKVGFIPSSQKYSYGEWNTPGCIGSAIKWVYHPDLDTCIRTGMVEMSFMFSTTPTDDCDSNGGVACTSGEETLVTTSNDNPNTAYAIELSQVALAAGVFAAALNL